jgi:hypothetical protein
MIAYTSVWDNGTAVTTPCEYDADTKTVSNIKVSDVDVGEAQLVDEYVELPDGTELRASDGVTFDY